MSDIIRKVVRRVLGGEVIVIENNYVFQDGDNYVFQSGANYMFNGP